ncbi:hypothetical protein D3260_10385 [Salinisphaera sp. Q1T1-3]|nr:hypothetical protein D3260_10385 [Salinisphaera sp. Q1T1-3]
MAGAAIKVRRGTAGRGNSRPGRLPATHGLTDFEGGESPPTRGPVDKTSLTASAQKNPAGRNCRPEAAIAR